MPTLQPIQPHQVAAAREMIYRVAHPMFEPSLSYEEAVTRWDANGILADMDDVEQSYTQNGGAFLVWVEDDGRVVGTGALRYLEPGVGELKRVWLLQEYQGQKLGYRIMLALFEIARQKGYHTLRLETNLEVQHHAVDFYRRLGFYEIPLYGEDPDSIAMEIRLED